MYHQKNVGFRIRSYGADIVITAGGHYEKRVF